MELEQFIATALIGIAKGVRTANMGTQDFVPGHQLFFVEPASYYKDRSDGWIKFDIAVTASSEDSATGGGGIKVLSVGLTGAKEVRESSQIASRITFGIAPQTAIF